MCSRCERSLPSFDVAPGKSGASFVLKGAPMGPPRILSET